MHQSLTVLLLQARETAMIYFRPALKQYRLTEQQWRIIRVLADKRSIDFNDLARNTCILRPSLTGILTRMEREKLIKRMKPMSDQRKLYITLDSEGVTRYEQVKELIEEGHQAMENAFTSEKMAQFLALLNEFNAIRPHLQEDLDEKYEP